MLRPLIFSVALLAAACSPPAQQEAAKGEPGMNMETTTPAPAGPITGVGTVTAVDAAAGTISLDHGPIAAISWPAMSMQFTADNPNILQGIAVGDQVSFEIKSATETSVVTAVQKQ
jgi:Cu(I)/Ag(I) efflux system periplasmic protein CusF